MPATTEPAAELKPWIGYTIERYGDAALVTVKRYWFEGERLRQSPPIEQYETASRGATASANRAVAKAKAVSQ